MNHIHHLVPKHMGGTDDPSNLFKCTVDQHAELHLALYLQHGLREDWIAYHCLSGQMGKEEFMLEKCKLGGERAWTSERRAEQSLIAKKRFTGTKHTEESKKKMSKSQTGKLRHTDESKQKLKEANLGKTYSSEVNKSKGRSNKHNLGQRWWNNGFYSKMSRECPGTDWIRGRLINNNETKGK